MPRRHLAGGRLSALIDAPTAARPDRSSATSAPSSRDDGSLAGPLQNRRDVLGECRTRAGALCASAVAGVVMTAPAATIRTAKLPEPIRAVEKIRIMTLPRLRISVLRRCKPHRLRTCGHPELARIEKVWPGHPAARADSLFDSETASGLCQLPMIGKSARFRSETTHSRGWKLGIGTPRPASRTPDHQPRSLKPRAPEPSPQSPI